MLTCEDHVLARYGTRATSVRPSEVVGPSPLIRADWSTQQRGPARARPLGVREAPEERGVGYLLPGSGYFPANR
ncbi:hypothetical protein ACFQV2_30305 [Actinokineospora soli]|uniref:Uncharacterized protein n=1 Tax=Actinokineospora soli TaxID=1048753 RepID=A0ABW2TVF3_9PSEU